MKKIIVAVDGYSGCGKSSTAKALAKALDYTYLDTGAMYRAVTLFFAQNVVPLQNLYEIRKALAKIEISFRYNDANQHMDTYLNGENVEQEIRKMYVSEEVSQVSAISDVRRFLVAQQQNLGRNKGVVLDGRDIGTVVFPEAELKVFMTADVVVRAKRRQAELLEKQGTVDLQEIIDNFEKRDHIDTSRADSPLRQAEDAVVLDTSTLSFEEQVAKIVFWAKEKIGN